MIYKSIDEKAITLIALIITIIILVILAAVSIRAVYNMGIVNYAVNGAGDYAKSSKEEERTMQDTENFLEDAISRIKNAQEGDIETNTVPDELRRYVLGANDEGKTTSQLLSGNTFKDEVSTIADASTSITLLNRQFGEYKDGEGQGGGKGQERRIYIRYKNVGYKIIAYNLTKNVEVAYIPHGREGEIVQYSTDGVSQATNWLVLYDNGSTLDITPVTLDSNWTYTLGSGDPNATGSTALEKAMDSYENMASRLNTYCETIITNPSKQRVRSIGTQFDQVDTTARFSSDFLANNPTGGAGTYNGVAKIVDMNAEQDVIRMSYYSAGGTESGYTIYGYSNTGIMYWLASRLVAEGTTSNTFHARNIDNYGYVSNSQLWQVGKPGVYQYSDTKAVRPVVRVSSSQV